MTPVPLTTYPAETNRLLWRPRHSSSRNAASLQRLRSPVQEPRPGAQAGSPGQVLGTLWCQGPHQPCPGAAVLGTYRGDRSHVRRVAAGAGRLLVPAQLEADFRGRVRFRLLRK